MIITQRAKLSVLYFLCLFSVIIFLIVPAEYSTYGWIFLILCLIGVWRNTPPYKNYEFKMEHLSIDPTGKKPKLITAGIGHMWEVHCPQIDPEKGACFSISRIKGVYLNDIKKEKVGDFFLMPSPLDARLSHYSGHLDILIINENDSQFDKYIEKIKGNAFGIVLHIAGANQESSVILFEIITRKPSCFSWRDLFFLKGGKSHVFQ